jgi:ABC-type phosphate transport system substrate-binding protein
MRRALALAAAGLLASVAAQAQESSYKIIVNASNSATLVKREAVAQLFLNRRATWTNGPTADPVDQSLTSPVRETFSREILGMPLPSVQRYWRQRVMDLREFPPMVKGTDAEVVAYVAKNPGAIGYVAQAAELPATVKVLRVLDPIR